VSRVGIGWARDVAARAARRGRGAGRWLCREQSGKRVSGRETQWETQTYISAGIVVKIAEAGDGELKCAGDFVGVGQDGVDGVVGVHARSRFNAGRIFDEARIYLPSELEQRG